MQQIDYPIDPAFFGLPTIDELIDLRIWDIHYHGFDEQDRAVEYIRRMGVERVFALGVGAWGTDAEAQKRDARDRQKLDEWSDIVSGITIIDPTRPEASVEKINRWIADGPAVGIKYSGGGNDQPMTCAHPNNDPIIERAAELGAVIYIHTWLKVGDGESRYPGAGNNLEESTPMDVAELASRFPDVPMICGHSGGDWEIAARTIRPHENVLFEYSGTAPWSGMVDYGVNWLGADRLVWGGHITSRAYATELSKVFDADLTDAQRMKVLGENLRRIAAPIMREKGVDVTV